MQSWGEEWPHLSDCTVSDDDAFAAKERKRGPSASAAEPRLTGMDLTLSA